MGAHLSQSQALPHFPQIDFPKKYSLRGNSRLLGHILPPPFRRLYFTPALLSVNQISVGGTAHSWFRAQPKCWPFHLPRRTCISKLWLLWGQPGVVCKDLGTQHILSTFLLSFKAPLQKTSLLHGSCVWFIFPPKKPFKLLICIIQISHISHFIIIWPGFKISEGQKTSRYLFGL